MPQTRQARPTKDARRPCKQARRSTVAVRALRSRPGSALIEPQNDQPKDASNRTRKRPASSRERRPQCSRTGQNHQDEKPLRLLPGKTRAMTDSEETQLVDALSELLADWLADHPNAFRSVSEI
jgi:hypothetical protein